MNLVIDIGNTNIKWGVFRNNKMIEHHSTHAFSVEYFENILSKYSMLKAVCVSNTAENINYINECCLKFNINYVSIKNLSKLPVEIQYKTKTRWGLTV